MKTIALLPAHPSQIWLLRAVQKQLEAQQLARVVWVIRDKDVSLQLADKLGLDYVCISKASRGLLGNALEMWVNLFRCIGLQRKYKFDLWVTKYGAGNMAAWLMGGRSISFNDDDVDQVPLIAYTSYPFALFVVCPKVLRMGRFASKCLRYDGCHELAYLTTGDATRSRSDGGSSPLLFVRLSSLTAHHDKGIAGLSSKVLIMIVRAARDQGWEIMISAEGTTDPELSPYLCRVPVDQVHDVLGRAALFVGDSQTMTSEAAVMGVPAIRVSDFIGRLSVIDQLENYGLVRSFRPSEESAILSTALAVIQAGGDDLATVFPDRRYADFIRDKVSPVPVFVEAISRLLGSRT